MVHPFRQEDKRSAAAHSVWRTTTRMETGWKPIPDRLEADPASSQGKFGFLGLKPENPAASLRVI